MKRKETFYEIHKTVLKTLREDPHTDLEDLKSYIKQNYLPLSIDVELFLIDRSYEVYKTTFEKDLGLNLSMITEAKQYLDKTAKDGKIYISDFVSTDALDLKYKLYSYSKLGEESYFELGFIDNSLNNTLELLLLKDREDLKVSLFNVSKDEKQYYYHEVKVQDEITFKKHYYQKMIKHPLAENTDDKVINSVKFNKPIEYIEENSFITYLTLFDRSMFTTLGFDNIVIKLEIDIEDRLVFLDRFYFFFILSSLLVLSLMAVIIYFTEKRFSHPIDMILESIHRQDRISEDTVASFTSEFAEISKTYNNLLGNLKNEIEKNRELSRVDSLTNVRNRKAYDEKIKELFSYFNRYQLKFSYILFDIDDFKKVNDSYGHSIGDKVLIDVAKMVTSAIRKDDTLFRIGGEEFVILLPNTELMVV